MKRMPSSQQLARLQDVMSMRVRREHSRYLEKLEQWREARRKVEEQRDEVAVLDADMQSVIEYMQRNDVLLDPGKLQLAVSRRHWTVYDREKAQYYLDMAEGDLRQAAKALDQQKKIWLKATARENKLAEQCLQAKSHEQQQRDLRDEIESEDTFSVVDQQGMQRDG